MREDVRREMEATGLTELQAYRRIKDRRELARRADVRRQGYQHLIK